MRLVAVLGYSDGRTDALHPVCAERLARAEGEVRPDDVVLLSGWARGRAPRPEAELMADAWHSPARLVLDRTARSTLGNVLGVARAARSLEIDEIVLVTSAWHGRRASVLARAALAGAPVTLALATTEDRPAFRARVRELGCWAVLPLVAIVAARRGSVQI